MKIPTEVKKALFKLSQEDELRYNYLSQKADHTEEEHEEYLKLIARCEGPGGEFLDDEEIHK